METYLVYVDTANNNNKFWYGSNWVNFIEETSELVAELLRLSPNKRKYYQQGERAMRLILYVS